MAKILVVDDEESIRSSLKAALDRRGHETVTAGTCAEGEEYSRAGFDLIFLDVMLPDGNGVDLLKKTLAKKPDQIVIMISGHADVDTAVDAIRSGAHDFIEKPLSLDRVLITIDNAHRTHQLIGEKKRLSSLVYGEFVGSSPAITKIKRDIEKSSSRATRFLISGESGTGKELVAHLIHRHSRFENGPFVAVNCAALPSELVESELFGHTAGAFTGAGKKRTGRFIESDQGSIFLDEISEMPVDAQAKILRALEARQITPVGADRPVAIDCNVIAASNKNLDEKVAEGLFRQDLLYRLNVVEFKIPPLRERKQDIGPLSEYFLSRFANETGGTARRLTANALEFVSGYDFPGNIRELKNLMERVNIYCDASEIGIEDIKPLIPRHKQPTPLVLKEAVSAFEEDFIRSAVAANNGNMAETARQLGLERSHLYKKMRKFNRE